MGLLEERRCCQNYGLAFLSFPIEDRSVPSSFTEFDDLLNSVSDHLRNGKAVGVHCRAGIGRRMRSTESATWARHRLPISLWRSVPALIRNGAIAGKVVACTKLPVSRYDLAWCQHVRCFTWFCSWTNARLEEDCRRRRVPPAFAQYHGRLQANLVLIDGGSIVEAYTKRGLLYDLVIRHPHVDPDIFLWESRVFACENV